LENSLSAKVSCWLIRLLILGSGYNTMISHLGLIRTFPYNCPANSRNSYIPCRENRQFIGRFYCTHR
ncbi:hypothetical protein AB8R75_24530, partial [Klebsiella quasipneumoniae subsp. similipneumoniae]|uniref:hypothetical protein n=1 Tax=Klebsiella quasipneumoniae TaxID=1463165 RepID=UPI0038D23A7F